MSTTDPQDEVFPLVDERDIVIGSVTRKEANSNPRIIHRAIEVLIYNTLGELLIQKRSSTKDVMPNTWSLSVGGHVNYGDIATAKRNVGFFDTVKEWCRSFCLLKKSNYCGHISKQLRSSLYA